MTVVVPPREGGGKEGRPQEDPRKTVVQVRPTDGEGVRDDDDDRGSRQVRHQAYT